MAAEHIDRKRVAVRRREVVELDSTDLDRVTQPALRSLDGVVAMSSARRMSLVVALVPSVDGKRLFEDSILDYLRLRGVAVVDLDDYGFEPGDYFAADGHWNVEGHRKAAAVLADVSVGPVRRRARRAGGDVRSMTVGACPSRPQPIAADDAPPYVRRPGEI